MQRTANPRMWVRFPPGPRDARPRDARPRRRARRPAPRPWLIASIVLHVALLCALLVSRAPPPPNLLAPQSEVAMVFEPGAPPPSTAPEVQPEQPPLFTPPQPSPPPQPQPPAAPTEVPAPPAPAAQAVPEAPPSVRITPPPAEPPPLALAPEAELPLPQLRAPPAEKPSPPAPAAAPRPSPGSRAAQGGFPKPMFRDFFIPPSGNHSDPTYRAYLAANQQAPQRGPAMDTQFDARGAEQLGSDWFGRFKDWVERHKPAYPVDAIQNRQDGDSVVEFTVTRDGLVHDLNLVSSSGTASLDLTLKGLFRDRHLPQFPQGASQDSITITFTMQYILIFLR